MLLWERSFFLLAGCVLILIHAAQTPVQSAENKTVTISEKDNGAVIDIDIHTQVRLELSGTPTSGYWWYFQVLDQEFLELVGEETRELSRQGIEGGRMLGAWLLRPRRVGSTSLRISYYRPWQGSEKAIRVFSVALRIRQ